MHRVVIVAPSASSELPPAADASDSADAIGWLGAAFAQRGFRVTVVDERNVGDDIARATQGATPDDVLVLHLSGRLAPDGTLRAGGGRSMNVRDVGSALALLSCRICVISELRHEDSEADALAAAGHVGSVVSAMGARERGFTMVSVVRPASSRVAALAFTRLLLHACEPEDATLWSAYEHVTSLPAGLAAAQSFTLVRGPIDFSLSPAPDEEPPPAPPPAAPPPAAPPPAAPPPAPVASPDLETLITAATDARDWRRVVELRRSRLPGLPSSQHRARELVTIARILQAEMGDANAAIGALEEARALAPTRVGVLQALRRGYEKLGRWASAIEVVTALAGLEQSGAVRAELRVALATMVQEHLQDEDRAISLLEAALKDDPSNAAALAALQRLRPPREIPAAAESAEIIEEESTRQLPTFRDSVPPSEKVPAIQGDPMAPLTHSLAFEDRMRAGHSDAAYLSAMALEDLGAARPEHLALIERLRKNDPIRPRAPLDATAWPRLRAPGSDDVLEALFGGISRASSAARVEQLIARDRLVVLDPATRMDESSTAPVWRTFQWAAQVLAVPCPDIYVVDEVPGEIAAVRAAAPSTAVGPTVVGGRSAKELAFLAGRHLTYYRPEHQVLVYFPTHDELERLLLASVELALPGSTGATSSRAVTALRARLERLVTPEDRAVVTDAAQRLVGRRGQASLAGWARSVELTAGRVGLFLCGDLATATTTVDMELRGIAGLTGEDRRRDLVGFGSSEAHASLRQEFVQTEPGGQP
jgi:tetratricopeptide (TPR) repeat protein